MLVYFKEEEETGTPVYGLRAVDQQGIISDGKIGKTPTIPNNDKCYSNIYDIRD